MGRYTYTKGYIEESISIMKESAQWLIDKGCTLWNLDDLKPERISHNPEEYIVMWNDNESVATLVLSYQDKIFWPNIPENTSGFIHKVSIRRKYAGVGDECERNGIKQLRLDCDNRKQLRDFYESIGFIQKDIKQIGKYTIVFYEYFI